MSDTAAAHARNSTIGIIPGTSSVVRVEYRNAVEAVDELIQPPDTDEFLVPGFVDLQVNGFAGVDYNDPHSSPQAIARSIRTMFSTGVARFFPTVITGSEERITGAVRNLRAST